MRIFLDANVLFSASNPKSSVAKLVGLLTPDHTLWSSQYALAEAEKNVLVKKPEWKEGFMSLKEDLLISPQGSVDESIELVEKDRPILGSALAGKCDYLVTGDRRHFGHLYGQTIQGVKIVSLAELAEDLL